jgi:predicted DNA-binding transcriptional regulator AlpA
MAPDANASTLVLLDTKEAADFLKLSPRTLENFRNLGDGPPFRKLGRRVLYARSDLEAWVNARIFGATSDDHYPGSE